MKVLQTVLFERKISIQKNINSTLRRVSNQKVEEIKKQILIDQQNIFEKQQLKKIDKIQAKFEATKDPKYLYRIKKK